MMERLVVVVACVIGLTLGLVFGMWVDKAITEVNKVRVEQNN